MNKKQFNLFVKQLKETQSKLIHQCDVLMDEKAKENKEMQLGVLLIQKLLQELEKELNNNIDNLAGEKLR